MKYAINPLAPFPKLWRNKHGDIRVMCEPVEGYVLARHKGCAPFAIRVSQLLNADRYPHPNGPFEPVKKGGDR